jgi:hypothetical protein
MNTYTWKIDNLTYSVFEKQNSNVVNNISWSLLGTDGIFSGAIRGVESVLFDESKPFIAYSDLTEDVVVEWVKNCIGEQQINVLKLDIDAQIKTQANPTTSSGLPWGK